MQAPSSPNIDHILLAHDFGDSAEPALAYALAIAEKFGARITIVHVFEPPSYEFPESLIADLKVETHIERVARKTLDSIGARAAHSGVPVAVVLRKGKAWSEIVALAEETNVSLLVLGTHGRRGIARTLIGSVAEKVVRTAHCPVLTIHGRPAMPTEPPHA